MIKIVYTVLSTAILEILWYFIFPTLPDFLIFPSQDMGVGIWTFIWGFLIFFLVAVAIALTSRNFLAFSITTALVCLVMGFNALFFAFLRYSPPDSLFGLTEPLIILILILDPIFSYFLRNWIVKRFA